MTIYNASALNFENKMNKPKGTTTTSRKQTIISFYDYYKNSNQN